MQGLAEALAGRMVGYRLAIQAASVLPPVLAYRVARQVGRFRYRQLWHGNEGRRQSLAGGLGVDREQADAILDQFFQLWACDDLESIWYRFWTPGGVSELIDVRGLENLNAALAHGRGAILYSGHVHGQYTLLAALGLRGYHPTLVRLSVEKTLSPLRRWLLLRKHDLLTRKFGCRFIAMYYQDPADRPSGPESVGRNSQGPLSGRANSAPRPRDLIVGALSRNEVVVVLIDMPFTRHKVEVRFFDQPVVFPAGPAEIARESGAPLLDFYIHRDETWCPQIAEIGAPMPASESATSTLQSCAARLEERIRRYPPGWAGWHVIAGPTRAVT